MLPPNNRHDDADKDKFAAIGESDRMTLRFVKPQAESETAAQ
jgi:predicted methyltransferase